MKVLTKAFFAITLTLSGLASLNYLAQSLREQPKDHLSILELIKQNYFGYKPEISKENDKKWANKILKGGYILLFRHAEREKWIDVEMYDSIESDLHDNGKNGTRFAEKDYFEKAVCLNSRGKVQAKAMGEIIKFSGLPIGKVISSPSCRSRQTADIAFGGYDELERNLVHKGPYYENMNLRNNWLREYILSTSIKPGTNTIISAHNSVAHCSLFSNLWPCELRLEEGGFYVIKKEGDQLKLVYEFNNFLNYSKVFFAREYN